jgi:glycosyltransferase involved in cell wall biosynthesis
VNILVTAKLSDSKLISKLVGLQSNPQVRKIILLRNKPLNALKVYNVTPPQIIANNKPLYEIWRFFSLFVWCSRRQVNLVIGIQGIFHGIASTFVANICNKPSVLWAIGSDIRIWAKKPVLGFCLRWAIGHATTVLIMGHKMKAEIKVLTGRAHNMYITLPAAPEMTSGIPERYKKKWDIVYVGNLTKLKNVSGILKIIKRLKDNDIRARFIIVGEGPLKNTLMKETNSLNLTDQVDFAGYQPYPQRFMVHSKLFVLLSKSEGFPSVITEAGFCGLPVVATDVGDIRLHFDNSSFVVLVDQKNIDEQYQIIKQLLTNPKELAKLSGETEKFVKTYREKWGTQGQVAHWDQIFTAVRRND